MKRRQTGWIEHPGEFLLRRPRLLRSGWVLLAVGTLIQGALARPGDFIGAMLLLAAVSLAGFGVMWLLRGWYVLLESMSERLVPGWTHVFHVSSPVFVVVMWFFNAPQRGDVPVNGTACLFLGIGIAAEIIGR